MDNFNFLQTSDNKESESVESKAVLSEKDKLTERETRKLIDDQLRKVGWEADTENLKYSNGARPQKGKKMAIAEWPVKPTKKDDDRADYALFIDEQLIGIIEAKAYGKSVFAIIDNQCHEYAKNVKDEDVLFFTRGKTDENKSIKNGRL